MSATYASISLYRKPVPRAGADWLVCRASLAFAIGLRRTSRPATAEEGFATAAATIVSLGVSLVVAAVVAASVVELRLAQAEMIETQLRAALDGGHQRAVRTLMMMGSGVRFRWDEKTAAGEASATAESETAKLSIAAAFALKDNQLRLLGVDDPADLRKRLDALARQGTIEGLGVSSLDAAPTWQACARSLISPYGGDHLVKSAPTSAGLSGPNGRVAGEVWRVRLTLKGWTDDRVVRFTGGPFRPAGVIDRRFYRREPASDTCTVSLGVR